MCASRHGKYGRHWGHYILRLRKEVPQVEPSTSLVNRINLVYNSFLNMFIAFLYVFRATTCPLSGTNTVPMWHLVFVTRYRWLSSMQVDLHTRESSTGWHKKTGNFEYPNKNWRNLRKKIIDRNGTITTCLLRDSNPAYQCLKITSCRWCPPPRMHCLTATTHFKSSRSFVSPSI